MKKSCVGAFLATSAVFLGIGTGTVQAQLPTASIAAQQVPDYSDAPDQKAALARYLQRSFDEIDTNHDGKIDRQEWAAFQEKYLVQQRTRFERRFKATDKNGDGFINRDEAKAAEPFLYQHFDEIDLSHDGKLSQAEVRAFIRKFRREQAMRDASQTKP